MVLGVSHRSIGTQEYSHSKVHRFQGEGFGLLVPVSSTHLCASTTGLSRSSSRTDLGGLILERASRLDAFSGYRSGA